MLGKNIKVFLTTLALLSIPVCAIATPRAIIADSITIDKGDGSSVIPPSEVLTEILDESSKDSLKDKGSITIKADIVDGEYKVKEIYKNVQIDLNNINTANDLEMAAELFKDVAQTDNIMKTDSNGQCSIDNLEIGVYLVKAKNIANYDNITPFIVSIPAWSDTNKTMSYDLEVIPKHTEITEKGKSKVPATGYNDKVMMNVAVGSICLVGSVFLFLNVKRERQ